MRNYNNSIERKHTRVINIGGVLIGGNNPIAIQSMTNTRTENVDATVEQIAGLEAAGCEIIRCAVPTMEAAQAIGEIKKRVHIPVVADIHFDYRLAIAAMENGVDKIRINPGNIGKCRDRCEDIVHADFVDTVARYLYGGGAGTHNGAAGCKNHDFGKLSVTHGTLLLGFEGKSRVIRRRPERPE